MTYYVYYDDGILSEKIKGFKTFKAAEAYKNKLRREEGTNKFKVYHRV